MKREGTLESVDGRPVLRFERRYRHSIERVWRAVSDPDEMAQWFPSNVEGTRAVGSELLFLDDTQRAAAREAGEPTRDDGPLVRGTVVAWDPPHEFAFTWGGELVRFELTADGPDTVLVFTQVLSHQSVAARNGSGWHMCLAALDQLLGAPPAGDADWMEIYDDYLDRLGPQLGVPSGDGAMTWERSTHVEADRVRAAVSEPGTVAEWGGAERAGDAVRWEVEATEYGTLYRLVHEAIGGDAQLAATWHVLLVQLDMYLAAGQLVPVDAKRWIAPYEAVL